MVREKKQTPSKTRDEEDEMEPSFGGESLNQLFELALWKGQAFNLLVETPNRSDALQLWNQGRVLEISSDGMHEKTGGGMRLLTGFRISPCNLSGRTSRIRARSLTFLSE